MNKETKQYLTSLLLKFNSHQAIIDEDQLIFNSARTFGYLNNQPIELEDTDAFNLIQELCEALNIFDKEE